MKKSKNGYYKYYNSAGVSTRIRNEFKPEAGVLKRALIKFKLVDEISWMYHTPTKSFKDQFEVMNHVLKNLESENMVFKIYNIDELKKEKEQ